jgi:hypothetical protein
VSDRSPEIDFDAFGPPTAPAPETRGNVEGPVEAARRHHEEVFETPTRTPTKNVTPIPRPIAIFWPTRTGGPGHICVIVSESVDPMYRCTTCEAAVKGNHECWAQAASRKMVAAYEEA